MYGIAKQILVGYALYFINCNIIAAPNVNSLQVILDPRLIIESQEINLGADKVTISTKIYNPSTENLLQTLASSQEQLVSSDDQSIELVTTKMAISNDGIDITALLKGLGIPLDPITAIHAIDASPNRDSIRKQLLNSKLLDKDAESPQWSLKQYNYWRQNFPARGSVTIKQTYKITSITKNIKLTSNTSYLHLPVQLIKKAYNFATNWRQEDQASLLQLQNSIEASFPEISNYCPKAHDYQALLELKGKSPTNNSVDGKTLILAVAADMLSVNPIKHFVLKIQHAPSVHPLLCWMSDAKAQDKNNISFEAHNFIHMQDIKVLLLEK